jgi:hypothetical protein
MSVDGNASLSRWLRRRGLRSHGTRTPGGCRYPIRAGLEGHAVLGCRLAEDALGRKALFTSTIRFTISSATLVVLEGEDAVNSGSITIPVTLQR